MKALPGDEVDIIRRQRISNRDQIMAWQEFYREIQIQDGKRE